jgi:asparagine synthase (glutamine-hydrolysing)
VKVTVHDPREAADLFSKKLRECVRMHLRSDVPVGCALSGGLDSSAVAVLVDEQNKSSRNPLRTFTATFPGDSIDESDYANAIISVINAEPYAVTPRPEGFLEDLHRFLWIHDEPVGSFSMYAGYCIARLTHQSGVTVTLHGQGGDEILSGYWQSYFLYLHQLWRSKNWTTLAGHFGGALMKGGNRSLWTQVPIMARRYISRKNGSKVRASRDPANLLEEIMSLDEQSARVFQIRTMFLPRLLKWDDRNSMSFSVEARYPFLDHELIDLCLSFAPETLSSRGWTKFPLRLGLNAELPVKVRYRKTKFGFETPQGRWLCGPLQPYLKQWLNDDRPAWGYLDRHKIRSLA